MKWRIYTKPEVLRGAAVSSLNDQRGFVLVIALLIMTLLAILGAMMLTTSTMDSKISGNVVKSKQSLLVSEAGISKAIDYLRVNPSWGPTNNDKSVGNDFAQTWAAQSQGTVQLNSGVNGTYSVVLYDEIGTNGRLVNSTRADKYTALGGSDVLLEVTGTVGGVTKKVGLVVRTNITAFDYATYSDNQFSGNGAGNAPGTFIGKLYAGANMQLQGNYNLSQAQAQAVGNITPDCNSGKFQNCTPNSAVVTPPLLDFAWYQNQSNFAAQQVFNVTPSVGSVSSCGASCSQWPINYAVTTLGTSYTVKAMAQAVKVGSNYNHTVSWCADKTWTGTGNCPGGAVPNTFTFTAPELKNEHAMLNAPQFNAYTAPTGAGYTSSVVNFMASSGDIRFLGPPAGQTTTITASIMVGTASNNPQPAGELEFVGGAGTLNLQPANGLAIVAKEVQFESKYGNMTVNVGTASSGAVIAATREFEVEAGTPNTTTFTMNGSVVAGDGTNQGEFGIGGNGVTANFTYTPVKNLPQGWQNYGSISVSKREWREL